MAIVWLNLAQQESKLSTTSELNKCLGIPCSWRAQYQQIKPTGRWWLSHNFKRLPLGTLLTAATVTAGEVDRWARRRRRGRP